MTTSTPATPIRRILVPTDFSENARTALDWALELARRHRATVTLLHVAKCVSMTGPPVAVQEQISASLSQLQDVATGSGVDITSVQQSGRPWERISAEAAEYDLVVIGARGQTPHTIHVFGIGSTVDRVLRTCPTPVLTVHTDESPMRMSRHILMPTDFSGMCRAALDEVVRLFGDPTNDPFEITVLHAWQPLVDYECSFAGTATVVNTIDGTEEQAGDTLMKLAERIDIPGVRITPVLRVGHPAQVIEEEAATRGADLIALGTHGRSGLSRWILGSVAERVIHHAPCPVLTVHSISDAERAVVEESLQDAAT